MRIIVAVLVVATLPLLAQHEKDAEKPKNPAIGDPIAIDSGKKQFADGCGICHGPEGQGGRGPNLRQRVFWHPLDEETIFKAIKKGVGAGMPPANLDDATTWQVVAYVVSLTQPAAEYNVPGDPKAGEAVFFGKGGCNECHTVRRRGGNVGPDLSNAGGTRSLAQLRESLLDPDADGAYNYRGVTITMRNGKTLKGIARNRSNYSLQLQDAQGDLHLLNVADFASIKITSGSPMPKDFAKRLNKDEIENVLAFLAKQSVRAVEISRK